MNYLFRMFSVVTGLFLCAQALAAGDRLVAGQWQFTMTTDGATRTFGQCITAEKAAEINGDSKSGRASAEKNAQGRCSVDAYDASGDKVSYTLTCGNRVMHSVTTFHGDTSDGSLTTTTDGKAVATSIVAKRTGACP
jgi:hypothetical protein